MAGSSNGKDRELDDFEYVERQPRPNNLLKHYEHLQCELELDYEVLSFAELCDDNKAEEKNKQDKKRLDEIRGVCWSDHAKNIIHYTKNGGNYQVLTQLLDYGLGRAKTCDANWKLATSFKIVNNNLIGMINHKRLGCPQDEEVTWRELNQALVEAISLLCVLSDRMKVRFKNFFPVPHDSKPFIIALSDQRILPLFGTGRFFKFKSKDFDDALVAFLDCISQLNDAVKITTPHQTIPHNIDNDKLEDPGADRKYTIRLQEATNVRYWSRALMFMLNNMNWLLNWVPLYNHALEPPPDFGALLKDYKNKGAFSS